MKLSMLRVSVLVASLAGAALLAGCRADTSGLATLTVAELSDLLAKGAGVVPCDANGADVRAKYGVIPGAILLSDHRDYNPASELPAGKKLVFYCASEMCSAAPTAARKAVAEGFSDVYVLPAGIKGWVKAEKPVQRPPAG